jgi:hypothetical protein
VLSTQVVDDDDDGDDDDDDDDDGGAKGPAFCKPITQTKPYHGSNFALLPQTYRPRHSFGLGLGLVSDSQSRGLEACLRSMLQFSICICALIQKNQTHIYTQNVLSSHPQLGSRARCILEGRLRSRPVTCPNCS